MLCRRRAREKDSTIWAVKQDLVELRFIQTLFQLG